MSSTESIRNKNAVMRNLGDYSFRSVISLIKSCRWREDTNKIVWKFLEKLFFGRQRQTDGTFVI
jgi:hypothetical protein